MIKSYLIVFLAILICAGLTFHGALAQDDDAEIWWTDFDGACVNTADWYRASFPRSRGNTSFPDWVSPFFFYRALNDQGFKGFMTSPSIIDSNQLIQFTMNNGGHSWNQYFFTDRQRCLEYLKDGFILSTLNFKCN